MKFKPEDFTVSWCEPTPETEVEKDEMDIVLAHAVCKVANARLKEMLTECLITETEDDKEFYLVPVEEIEKPNDSGEGQ